MKRSVGHQVPVLLMSRGGNALLSEMTTICMLYKAAAAVRVIWSPKVPWHAILPRYVFISVVKKFSRHTAPSDRYGLLSMYDTMSCRSFSWVVIISCFRNWSQIALNWQSPSFGGSNSTWNPLTNSRGGRGWPLDSTKIKQKSEWLADFTLHVWNISWFQVSYFKFQRPSSDLLHDLHWLPIRQRIHYKIATITYKAMWQQQPTYI